jgi:hypothetical protein
MMENFALVKNLTRRHPLDPLSAEEVGVAVRTLRTHGPACDHLRFVSVNLHQPAKTELESIGADHTPDRRAFIILLDLAARRVLEALVSLREGPCCLVRSGAASSPVSSSKSSSCVKMQSRPILDSAPRSHAEVSPNSIRLSSIPGRRAPTAMNIFPTVGLPRASPGFAAAMPMSAMAVRLRD